MDICFSETFEHTRKRYKNEYLIDFPFFEWKWAIGRYCFHIHLLTLSIAWWVLWVGFLASSIHGSQPSRASWTGKENITYWAPPQSQRHFYIKKIVPILCCTGCRSAAQESSSLTQLCSAIWFHTPRGCSARLNQQISRVLAQQQQFALGLFSVQIW